jgi:hypothetical protein
MSQSKMRNATPLEVAVARSLIHKNEKQKRGPSSSSNASSGSERELVDRFNSSWRKLATLATVKRKKKKKKNRPSLFIIVSTRSWTLLITTSNCNAAKPRLVNAGNKASCCIMTEQVSIVESPHGNKKNSNSLGFVVSPRARSSVKS